MSLPGNKIEQFKYGRIFLGRDEAKYGKEGTGLIGYNPDFECGGPEGTPARQCPYQPRVDHTHGLNLTGFEGRLLHVAIASYRDPLCPRTLFNLFTKSSYPEKLRVRVLQQNDPTVDIECLKGYCSLMAEKNGNHNESSMMQSCPYVNQIHIHSIHAKEAAGPTFARALLSQDMYDAFKAEQLHTQDHCMSIDSHMDFSPDWDTKMVEMWDQTNNEYAVLSTYVSSTDQLQTPLKDNEVPLLCMVIFTSNVRNHATKAADSLVKPKLTNAIWGAGLSFSKCHAELKVPVDPHTPMVFDGEEFNRAARFWTYGYDIYTPHRVYVFHDYNKAQSNPVMQTWAFNQPAVSREDANKRLLTMIDVPGGETDPQKVMRMKQSRFGLGDRRTLDQLIQFSGIDLRNKRETIDGKNRCGNLQWVPFVEHPKGVNHIPAFNPTTEDPLDLPYDPSSIWFTGSKAFEIPKVKEEEIKRMLPEKPNELDPLNRRNIDREQRELHDRDIPKIGELGLPADMNLSHAKVLHQREEIKMRTIEKAEPVLSNAEAVYAAKNERNQGAVFLRHKIPLLSYSQDFLVNHAQSNPEDQGMWFLPHPIQVSVVFLVCGLVVSIVLSAKVNRRKNRNDHHRVGGSKVV